jgi:hypothetical protein
MKGNATKEDRLPDPSIDADARELAELAPTGVPLHVMLGVGLRPGECRDLTWGSCRPEDAAPPVAGADSR